MPAAGGRGRLESPDQARRCEPVDIALWRVLSDAGLGLSFSGYTGRVCSCDMAFKQEVLQSFLHACIGVVEKTVEFLIEGAFVGILIQVFRRYVNC